MIQISSEEKKYGKKFSNNKKALLPLRTICFNEEIRFG